MEQEEHQDNQRSYHQKKKKKKQRSDNRNQPFLVACQTMEQEAQQKNVVLEEILSRLPVKSLLRFMCVCRHWKSLISSHSFRKLHRQKQNSSPPLLLAFHSSVEDGFTGKFGPGMLFDYHLTTFDLYGKVIQQCTLPISSEFLTTMNLPSQSKLVCFTDDRRKRFFSYNPSTRQFFRLPDPPCFSLPDFKLRSSSFGYIPSKDEYMMVHVVDRWVCEVLTMSISNDNNYQLHFNEWRSIEVTTMLSHVVFGTGVFVCGAFYWNARDENGNVCILSFDVETEVFSTFVLPQGVDFGTGLLELRDELYIMNEPAMPPTLDLWKLSSDVNDNKSWTLYWNINLQSLGFTNAPDPNVFDWRILIYRLEYLQCYNQPCNILREMGKLKLEDDYSSKLEANEEYVMPDLNVSIHTNLFTL